MNGKHRTIYLCGGIEGLSYDEAYSWRKIAREELQNKYIILDPLDNKHETWSQIVKADIENVRDADILLVEMKRYNHAYIGTSMEIRDAWVQGKEIYVWGIANRDNYFLVEAATKFFDTLGEALDFLKKR